MHRGVVDAGSLMDVEIDTVVGLELEGGLHGRRREGCRRSLVLALLHGGGHLLAYILQPRAGVEIFLSVVVAGNPPGGVVAGHGKLRILLLDGKVVEIRLCGEFIAKTHTVVVNAEAYHHEAVELRLGEFHGQLVVVVADLRLLAPHGLPGLVERCGLRGRHLESARKLESVTGSFSRGLCEIVASRLIVEGQAKARGRHYLFPLEVNAVRGHAPFEQVEAEHQLAVGRRHLYRFGAGRHRE